MAWPDSRDIHVSHGKLLGGCPHGSLLSLGHSYRKWEGIGGHCLNPQYPGTSRDLSSRGLQETTFKRPADSLIRATSWTFLDSSPFWWFLVLNKAKLFYPLACVGSKLTVPSSSQVHPHTNTIASTPVLPGKYVHRSSCSAACSSQE